MTSWLENHQKKTVTVIIPAYNEQDRIKDTIDAIKSIASVGHIRVVNDGSTDKTADIAEETGVEVLNLLRNVGKGEALNQAVKDLNCDIAVFIDADLGASAAEAIKIIEPVIAGKADLCVGKFPAPQKKGGFGLVKKLARWGIARFGMEAAEPLSGQRAMTLQVLNDVVPFNSGYGIEVGMSIKALRKGYRILEVPVQMSHAETGRDLKGFIHRGRQFLDVLKVILKEGGRRTF